MRPRYPGAAFARQRVLTAKKSKKMVFGWVLDYFFCRVAKIQGRATATGQIKQELRRWLQSKWVYSVIPSKCLIPVSKSCYGMCYGRKFVPSQTKQLTYGTPGSSTAGRDRSTISKWQLAAALAKRKCRIKQGKRRQGARDPHFCWLKPRADCLAEGVS